MTTQRNEYSFFPFITDESLYGRMMNHSHSNKFCTKIFKHGESNFGAMKDKFSTADINRNSNHAHVYTMTFYNF